MLKFNFILQIKAKNIPMNKGKINIKISIKFKYINKLLSINSITMDKTPIKQYLINSLFCRVLTNFTFNI